MKEIILVSDIIWDGEKKDIQALPKLVALENVELYFGVYDAIANILCNIYGFCAKSFTYEGVDFIKVDDNNREPDTLSEIATVTYEYGRLVLRVDDPIKARKFGLSDNTYKYEFDGGTMYWYKEKGNNVSSSWSCSCGRGGYTLVNNSTERQIRAVKNEMVKQLDNGLLEKYMDNMTFKEIAIQLNAYYWTKDRNIVRRK